MEPFDDENIPLYTVGQVAEMLSLKQAFLRRIDELQVVSPQRSAGRQRRYTRVEIRVIQQVASMADEGMTMTAIRRIIELEQQLAEVVRPARRAGGPALWGPRNGCGLLISSPPCCSGPARTRKRTSKATRPRPRAGRLHPPPPGLAAGEQAEHDEAERHDDQQPRPGGRAAS